MTSQTAPTATETVECTANIDVPNQFDRNVFQVVPCDFTGDVEVEVDDLGGTMRRRTWTCPACATEHEEDIDLRDC